MSEQQFGWNYFENEVVIGDKQDKKRMIVLVFSNFMDIPYNRKSFDEIVGLLNEQNDIIKKLEKKAKRDDITIRQLTENIEKLIEETEIAQLLQNEYDKTEQLEEELKKANAFIVEKGLELEFVKWCKKDEGETI